MDIQIETDARGQTNIVLTDEAKYGTSKKGLPPENIMIRATDGHVFLKSSVSPGGLSRLSEAEVLMVEFWLRERGAGIEPNIFAGNPPGDG